MTILVLANHMGCELSMKFTSCYHLLSSLPLIGVRDPILNIIAGAYVLFGMALLAMCFNFAEQKVGVRLSWMKDQYRRKRKLRNLG